MDPLATFLLWHDHDTLLFIGRDPKGFSGIWSVPATGGEATLRVDLQAGLGHVLRDVTAGARIGIVTSAGPIGVAVGLVFGASETHMVRTSLVIRNASITELRFRSRDFAWHPERVSLLSFNSISHLPAELHTEY
jgi:broad specificity phosphatase PhoE